MYRQSANYSMTTLLKDENTVGVENSVTNIEQVHNIRARGATPPIDLAGNNNSESAELGQPILAWPYHARLRQARLLLAK